MKKVIQKLQQESDRTPEGKYKNSIEKDILELKISKDNKFYLTIKNKYNV